MLLLKIIWNQHLIIFSNLYGSKYLAKYLFAGLSERYVTQIIVTPSFSTEYIVSIEPEKDENFIFFRTFEKPISQSYQEIEKGLVRKVEYKQKITKELADLLKEIIFEATSKVRYPKNEYYYFDDGRKILTSKRNGFDGDSYYFISSMYSERRAGKTWSPSENSIAGELVKLARLMKAASYDPKVNDQLYEFGSRLLIKIKTS